MLTVPVPYNFYNTVNTSVLDFAFQNVADAPLWPNFFQPDPVALTTAERSNFPSTASEHTQDVKAPLEALLAGQTITTGNAIRICSEIVSRGPLYWTIGDSGDGDFATLSIVLGGVTPPKALQGAAQGVGSASGSPSLIRALQGAADGQGVATGTLVGLGVEILQGAALGAGSSSGTLSKGAQALTGSAVGRGSSRAALIRIKAIAASTATGIGSAAGIAYPIMQGQAQGAGSASGQLGKFDVLVGSALGQGSARGNLLRFSEDALFGVARGIGSARATLKRIAALDGQAIGQGNARAALALLGVMPLQGAAAGIGTASARLLVDKDMQGAALGVGRAVGRLYNSTQTVGRITDPGVLSASHVRSVQSTSRRFGVKEI